MDELKSYLLSFHDVDESTLEAYTNLWKPYVTSRKQIVTVPDQVESHFYFVLDGVQKSYYLHDEKEHVIAFAYAPSFSGIPESFFNQTPSRYYLESLTKCQLLRIRHEDHRGFMQSNREIETLFRVVAERFLDGVIQRQHEIMALDMEARFNAFVKRSAHLLQLISQKDIASYLRIDPTNFSKLINRIKI